MQKGDTTGWAYPCHITQQFKDISPYHNALRLQHNYPIVLGLASRGIEEQLNNLHHIWLCLSIPERICFISHVFLPYHATKIPRIHKTLFFISGAKKVLFQNYQMCPEGKKMMSIPPPKPSPSSPHIFKVSTFLSNDKD